MSFPDFVGETPAPASPARPLVRWLYSQNPFYAISAALVFTGLRMTFDTGNRGFHVPGLLGSLAAYALLLAGTAWLLIRLGQVWDDVRSLLLLIVLMFVAIAVSLDDVLAADPVRGAGYCVGGWLLAVLLSQAVLSLLGIRLRTAYLLPYYAGLTHLFLYPLLLTRLLVAPPGAEIQWGLHGFSLVSGILPIMLLPAVRRGASYVQDNGTPWRWPLFPWSLFFVLAVGLALRGYYLCLSLHFVNGGNIFGWHFLVPLIAGATVLLLERSIVIGDHGLRRCALAMPIVWASLAAVGHRQESVYQGFLGLFRDAFLATPLYATFALAAAFYIVAACRRVRGSLDWLTLCLLAMSWFDRDSQTWRDVTLMQAGPIGLAAIVQLTLLILRRDPFRYLLVCTLGIMAWHMAIAGVAWAPFRWPVTGHLALGAVLIGAAVCKGDLGEFFRQWGAVGLAGFTLAALWWDFRMPAAPSWLFDVYPSATIAAALAMFWLTRDEWFRWATAGIAAAWMATICWRHYAVWRLQAPGLDYIVAGLLFFLAAAAISVSKTGRWKWRATIPKTE